MTASAASAAASPTVVATTTDWHALTSTEALARQGVDIDVGLAPAEADGRRAKVGANTFDQAKKTSRLQAFTRQYADPMHSSAGWPTSTSVPDQRSLKAVSRRAVPASTATWTSWPQACITGTS